MLSREVDVPELLVVVVVVEETALVGELEGGDVLPDCEEVVDPVLDELPDIAEGVVLVVDPDASGEVDAEVTEGLGVCVDDAREEAMAEPDEPLEVVDSVDCVSEEAVAETGAEEPGVVEIVVAVVAKVETRLPATEVDSEIDAALDPGTDALLDSEATAGVGCPEASEAVEAAETEVALGDCPGTELVGTGVCVSGTAELVKAVSVAEGVTSG